MAQRLLLRNLRRKKADDDVINRSPAPRSPSPVGDKGKDGKEKLSSGSPLPRKPKLSRSPSHPPKSPPRWARSSPPRTRSPTYHQTVPRRTEEYPVRRSRSPSLCIPPTPESLHQEARGRTKNAVAVDTAGLQRNPRSLCQKQSGHRKEKGAEEPAKMAKGAKGAKGERSEQSRGKKKRWQKPHEILQKFQKAKKGSTSNP